MPPNPSTVLSTRPYSGSPAKDARILRTDVNSVISALTGRTVTPFSIRGQVTYLFGTPGANKFLMSDASGNATWEAQSSIDHGSLGGLADDDHTQYRLESEDHSHASSGLQGGLVTWANINKTVSSLADLTTKSAGALDSGNLAFARMPTGAGTWAVGGDLAITGGYVRVASGNLQVIAGNIIIGNGGPTQSTFSIEMDSASTSNDGDHLKIEAADGGPSGGGSGGNLYLAGGDNPGGGSAGNVYLNNDGTEVRGITYVGGSLYPGNQTTRYISDDATYTFISGGLKLGAALYPGNQTSRYITDNGSTLDLVGSNTAADIVTRLSNVEITNGFGHALDFYSGYNAAVTARIYSRPTGSGGTAAGVLYLQTKTAGGALATAISISEAQNVTIAGTLTVNGNQTGATDHVFDSYDDIALLQDWRAGRALPFATGDLLNRDRLLRDTIIGLEKRVAELETKGARQ